MVPARRMLTASPSNGRWRSRVAGPAGKRGPRTAGLGGPPTAPLFHGPPRAPGSPSPRPSPPALRAPHASLPPPPPARPVSPSVLCGLAYPPSLPGPGAPLPKTRALLARSNHGNHSAAPVAEPARRLCGGRGGRSSGGGPCSGPGESETRPASPPPGGPCLPLRAWASPGLWSKDGATRRVSDASLKRMDTILKHLPFIRDPSGAFHFFT